MISREQEEDLKKAYKTLISADHNRLKWTEVDDILCKLDYLDDEELVKEVEIQIYEHSLGEILVEEEYSGKTRLLPALTSAVDAICESFQETSYLVPKCRYVLQNYLALSYLKIIYVASR